MNAQLDILFSLRFPDYRLIVDKLSVDQEAFIVVDDRHIGFIVETYQARLNKSWPAVILFWLYSKEFGLFKVYNHTLTAELYTERDIIIDHQMLPEIWKFLVKHCYE